MLRAGEREREKSRASENGIRGRRDMYFSIDKVNDLRVFFDLVPFTR